MRLALFGGSFDPFHNGHLAVVRELGDRGLCEQVLISPARISPGKPAPLAAGHHREVMAVLGAAEHAYVSVLDLELRRPGPSYTVETLAELSRGRPGDEWLLIVGADAWRDFRTWHDPDRILELARIVVFPRPGIDPDPASSTPRVTLLEDFLVPVTSTAIRRRIAAGESVTHLLPGRVLDYIRLHGLYGCPCAADDGG
ncbi:nicotinate (nicotinamide) nucleotide adenylyltransferase [bacterium]|nr:nicotinate (nicotinamide) nucleotide adenylyltransferase [bacterium]MBU1073565.1 nicotinate (nicotinamide) nucleotide adenylyltransferase [bacterium]MBU1674510.1 nicotinate (nicotinamide) nucleotide adenylyltransferase [bacterium]